MPLFAAITTLDAPFTFRSCASTSRGPCAEDERLDANGRRELFQAVDGAGRGLHERRFFVAEVMDLEHFGGFAVGQDPTL